MHLCCLPSLGASAPARCNGAGAALGPGALPGGLLFPDMGRIPERPRLGIRMERVPAVASSRSKFFPKCEH